MFKETRRKLNIDNKELDEFLGAKVSTKYYLEKIYLKNKFVRYLIFFRIKGVNLNAFFDEIITNNFKNYKKWKK
jgi:hypothetical protein